MFGRRWTRDLNNANANATRPVCDFSRVRVRTDSTTLAARGPVSTILEKPRVRRTNAKAKGRERARAESPEAKARVGGRETHTQHWPRDWGDYGTRRTHCYNIRVIPHFFSSVGIIIIHYELHFVSLTSRAHVFPHHSLVQSKLFTIKIELYSILSNLRSPHTAQTRIITSYRMEFEICLFGR